KFVLPALLAGTILGSGVAVQAASIEPRGGWAVTKVAETNISGGAYCTLARQYANGVIISIGRNASEEYSLAIDFQDDKLTLNKNYPLVLKAGNQTRSLDLMPASKRAMVVRLGWDDSFF